MPLFDVEHQEGAVRLLLRAIRGGRLPHAYAFCGPTGVGKRMLAERLARRLLCSSPVRVDVPKWAVDAAPAEYTDACGACDDCGCAAAGTHPDLHMIRRELHRFSSDADVRKRKGTELSIDVIREFLIEPAMRRPLRGRAKVFLVEEAELLSTASQNALLKTLEEPPPTTFIVLLMTSFDGVLPTTRSRCHPVEFRALPTPFVEARLAALRPELRSADAAYLARMSEGQLGLALRYADDEVPDRARRLGDALQALPSSGMAAFAKACHDEARACLDDRKDRGAEGARAQEAREEPREAPKPDLTETEAMRGAVRQVLRWIAGFYADALRRRCEAKVALVNADQTDVVDALASRHTPEALARAIDAIAKTESAIDANANVTLALEALGGRLAVCARG